MCYGAECWNGYQVYADDGNEYNSDDVWQDTSEKNRLQYPKRMDRIRKLIDSFEDIV